MKILVLLMIKTYLADSIEIDNDQISSTIENNPRLYYTRYYWNVRNIEIQHWEPFATILENSDITFWSTQYIINIK